MTGFVLRAWHRPQAVSLLFALLSACGSPTTATDAVAVPPDASADAAVDVPSDVPFSVAMHDPLPVVPDEGGPRLTQPQLVFITFADDTRAAAIEAFGRFIVGSSWLHTVGAEYGVSTGTFVAAVARTENAPDHVSDLDVQTLLAAGIADGSIPRPAGGSLANALYVVFYPPHTTVTLSGSGGAMETGCVDFYGYHSMARRSGLTFAYATIPTCPIVLQNVTDIEQTEYDTSHEIIEAATDPDPSLHPAWTFPPTIIDPWVRASGGELGDLCILEPDVVREAGHALTPVWSNAAAEAGNTNPCIPSDPSEIYYNVSAAPYDVQFADPGTSVTFSLTGWSSAPSASWTLAVNSRGAFMPTPHLDTTQMTNGGTATLTIDVPASAPHSASTVVYVYSRRGTAPYRIWPIVIATN